MHQTVNVGGEATSLGETVTSNRIVVGVDGSPGARSALLWAADECRVRRQMLLVVHAPDLADTVAVNPADEPAVRSLNEVGERMLSEHAAAASARQPRVVVGISPTTSGRFALEFAFDEAQRRAATLVAVQAPGTPDSAERVELAA